MRGLLTRVYAGVFVEKCPCHHDSDQPHPQLGPRPPFAFARPHTSTVCTATAQGMSSQKTSSFLGF